MAGFSFEKQNQYHIRLSKIFDMQSGDFRQSISREDFILLFPVIEVNGRGEPPTKPDHFDVSDSLFDQVTKAHEDVYG